MTITRRIISMGAAIATLLASACTAEPVSTGIQEEEGGIFTIKVSAPGDGPATRTAVNGTQDGAVWSSGDAINLFHATAGSSSYADDGEFTISEDKSSFTGTINGTLSARNDWYALYPYSSYVTTPASTTRGYMTMGATRNESFTQVQAGNNDMRHLAGPHMPLYGIQKAVDKGTTPSIRMHQLMSIISVDITNVSSGPITVKSVSFTGTEDIVGTFYINFADEEPSFKGSGSNYVSSTARLSVTGAQPLGNGGKASFFIAVKPFTAASGSDLELSATAVLADGTETSFMRSIKLSSSTSFKPGKIKGIAMEYGDAIVVTTGAAREIGSSEAILSASYSGATSTPREVRFEYGTSADALTSTAYFNDGGLSAPSGSFSLSISSLEPLTTYYYRAAIQFGDEDHYGELRSFTTTAAAEAVELGWLELPAAGSMTNMVHGNFGSGSSRNYSFLYDKSMYSPVWTAYPLTYAHTQGTASGGSWQFNPQFSYKYQVDVTGGSYPSRYSASSYARGHQIPAADRKCSQEMRAETYYVTNQTPQVQNSFNDGIWSTLENAIRGVTSSTDTLYVVTGPSFRKAGGNETISYLNSTTVSPARLAVPNYFWKAVLKVKRGADGSVTSASSIGFWFEHKAYSGTSYTSFAISVDALEELTGLDLFANLPDQVEAKAEANTSWSVFSSF